MKITIVLGAFLPVPPVMAARLKKAGSLWHRNSFLAAMTSPLSPVLYRHERKFSRATNHGQVAATKSIRDENIGSESDRLITVAEDPRTAE